MILVQAVPPHRPMGETTFGPEIGHPLHVRPITLDDLKLTAGKMGDIEGKEFSALLALRGALEANDDLAMASAKQRLEGIYQRKQKDRTARLPEAEDLRREAGMQWGVLGLTPEEALQHIEGLRPGPRAARSYPHLLSWAVSRAISDWAQLALWWVNGRFHPAIHCAGVDERHASVVALYVHTFLVAPNREVGFRICPYDGEQFFQEQTNQEYCCPAHGAAHRVARSRNKKKTQQNYQRKGRTDGAQKTR